jgi:acylphosphatase
MDEARTGPRPETFPDPAGDPQAPAQLTAWVKGRVQGVGFRWWTRCRARELDLTGVARNLDDGRVEVLVQGPRERCERLLDLLEEIEPSTTGRPGRVTTVTHRWSQPYETPVDFREA